MLVTCPAFCAATVCATAVCMLESWALSAVLSAPQAVRSNDEITVEVKSIYFIDLNIFFLS